MLCSRKGLECLYCPIDRRSLRGKLKLNNDIQIDKERSTENNDTSSSSDSTKTETVVDEIHRSHYINKSRIPSSLQPLLTFPVTVEKNSTINSNKKGRKRSIPIGMEVLPNQNGGHTRLLLNSAGNLRYFGESSPLSLLQECRFIFARVIGVSKFTDDPSKELVIDEPNRSTVRHPLQLPRRDLCNILVQFFEENINDTHYIFDMKYFKDNIIDRIYDNPISIEQSCICLLHLVLAIGAFYAEISPSCQITDLNVVDSAEFFDSSLSLMRDSVYDGSLWLVEANFLQYFYYQSCCKPSSSWMHLGIAIRSAQALGLHRRVVNERFKNPLYVVHRRRLWRSLFICDRISSINLGRPLAANDYDWDDQCMNFIADSKENFRQKCQDKISKIAHDRIVENIYRDGVINIRRANELAIELKTWSLNLPPDLDLSFTLKKFKCNDNGDNNLLMNVHMAQFYGIMLLCRPFLMYIIVRKLKPGTKSELQDNSSLLNFCKGCIKSSFLTIKLVNYYVENTTNNLELFVAINGCFFASVILGLSLLETIKQSQPDARYVNVLFDSLHIARKILYYYGSFNATSERWGGNVDNMLAALSETQNQYSKLIPGNASTSNQTDFETFNEEIISLDDEEFSLNNLMNFQQTFVPSNTDMNSEIFMYSEDVAKQNNDTQSLDVFMYDFWQNQQSI